MKIKKQIRLDDEFSIYSFDESTYDEVILFLEELLVNLKNKNLGYEKFIFIGSKLYGLVAAKNLNRQFIGIEKEKEYYDICLERLK